MNDDIDVIEIKSWAKTYTTLGVGCDDDRYFVYTRPLGASSRDWRKHCGPYSTFDQAADWIRQIQGGFDHTVDPAVPAEPPRRD